jgi:heme A synthase
LRGLEGNKVWWLIGMVVVWLIICWFMNRKLNEQRNNKTTAIIGGIGLLLILGFWAVRFLR